MKLQRIVIKFTDGSKKKFFGRYLRDRETPRWHYYEKVSMSFSGERKTLLHVSKGAVLWVESYDI